MFKQRPPSNEQLLALFMKIMAKNSLSHLKNTEVFEGDVDR
ncbi:hypothetical Protein YC6258_05011 [Gynuella sunshinyii YC6258]|uniref:Uncharacterized protein n=1 Tax=Gynuella sunshinyii YC6258 TaxID=1445510 RepID=A0A0C5VUR2_9GAMM|nr:hypothetical Protein YC6258_05011 [Gynuella sunshinyii YC6258]